jgi:hypothetical protein
VANVGFGSCYDPARKLLQEFRVDPVPWYPKAVVTVVAALLLALALVPRFRSWALTVDIRYLIAVHFVRFVGFYFLYLYSLGELPYNFAVLGGWGDIAVAFLAFIAILLASSKPAVVLWNLLGLADILAVAATAARDEIAVPGSMHMLDRLPLILIPTLFVPVIIVTHGLMVFRAIRFQNRARSSAPQV